MAPAATPPANPNSDPNADDTPSDGPVAFGQLMHTALRERTLAANDPQALLASGELLPQALCQFAVGKLAGYEREEFEGYLSRTPWVQGRVSALVIGSRPNQANPLASRIMSAAESGAVDPYREVAGALLESIGRIDALENDLPATGSEPLVRAACLLSRGDREQAHEAFAGLDSLPSPLAETAKRVADLSEQDEALLELLQAL